MENYSKITFKKKYLKYKSLYLNLKKMMGGERYYQEIDPAQYRAGYGSREYQDALPGRRDTKYSVHFSDHGTGRNNLIYISDAGEIIHTYKMGDTVVNNLNRGDSIEFDTVEDPETGIIIRVTGDDMINLRIEHKKHRDFQSKDINLKLVTLKSRL